MIPLLCTLAILAAGSEAAAAPPALPDPPESQVLDRMEWLSDGRRLDLESELARIRNEHGVDLFVVVWDRRLPDGETPEELATRIGESWSSGNIWGTVLLTPAAINRPTAVTGGSELSSKELTHLAAAATYSIDFGAKGWTDQDRLEQTARILAEELVFARQTMGPRPQNQPSGPVAQVPAIEASSFLSPSLLATTGALLVFLALLVWHVLRKRGSQQASSPPTPEPARRTFPTPSTPPRLGAPWSGGSSLIVPLSPQSSK